MKKHLTGVFVLIAVCWSAAIVNGQTTEFTYQGNLVFNGQPATGQFDFEFRLFPSTISSSQIGSTNSLAGVAVSNGTFTVLLNFGESYDNASRYLEINVRPAGTQSYTLLTPRQRVSSAPSSVNSRQAVNAGLAELAVLASNSNKLGGVDANQYVLTTDPRMTNARPPTSGSSNYVQTTTVPEFVPQTGNFNISGTGRAGIISASTQYNIGIDRVFGMPGDRNLVAGQGAGSALTTGRLNTFIGGEAGSATSIGEQNVFIGRNAGRLNTSGAFNVSIGYRAGENGAQGQANTFIGTSAGASASGQQNVFVGMSAGSSTSGNFNTYVGYDAGSTDRTGENNTMLGYLADMSGAGLNYATAIGAGAVVSTSNTIKLGRFVDTVIAPHRVIVGNQTTARGELSIYANSGNADLYLQGTNTTTGINIAASADPTPTFFISHYNGTTYTDRLIITPTGTVRIPTLGSAGGTSLCRNASNDISTCSSSARYKYNINDYRPGSDLIQRLRPVTFNWTAGDAPDLGLVAEEVAAIDPLLVTYNDKGEVEGVKYDRIGVVLINTVKEQQATIREQAERIGVLELGLNELKLLFCKSTPDSPMCISKEK